MKACVLVNHEEGPVRAAENERDGVIRFFMTRRTPSFFGVFDSAFATPARYVMEIARRMRHREDLLRSESFLILNPYFPWEEQHVGLISDSVKKRVDNKSIVVFVDKHDSPLGYYFPKFIPERECHYLTLLSTMSGRLDAAILRHVFLKTVSYHKIKHITQVKVNRPDHFYYNESYERLYCWITVSALTTLRLKYNMSIENGFLPGVTEDRISELKKIRDSITFVGIMPHHAGDVFFLGEAIKDGPTHIKKIVINKRYEDILKDSASTVGHLPISIPPPIREGNNRTEEEYFHDVVACLTERDRTEHFFNFLRPSRDYQFTDFHLIDHFSFALGQQYYDKAALFRYKASPRKAAEKPLHGAVKILLHFEGGWPIKVYPRRLQRVLIDNLYESGYEVSVLTAEHAKTDHYNTVKYENLAWYKALLASYHLVIGMDSFPVHYAAHKGGVPTICLFGPTRPVNSDAVASKRYRFLHKNMPCMGCRRFDTCASNGKSECFNFAEPEDVLNEALQMLDDLYPERHRKVAGDLAEKRRTLEHPVRILAFHFPQFHRFDENDMWWGTGFTEWVNVTKAVPEFEGHYQPRLPADLGFYDMMLESTREQQARLAKRYGLYGFIYYHYWFNGRRILEKVVDEMLKSGKPELPFCFCWANENWTKRWDGSVQEVMLEQTYCEEDDRDHILSLMKTFSDPRYIKIKGKPFFAVYRVELFPNPRKTAEIWREEAKRAGFPDLFLVVNENFKSGIDPVSIGFDAAIEFAPDVRALKEPLYRGAEYEEMFYKGGLEIGFRQNNVYLYDSIVKNMLAKPKAAYRRFHGVFPSWDNSPRRWERLKGSTIIHGSTPDKFELFVEKKLLMTYKEFEGEERLLFVNAWNEWAEGCYLEPDRRFRLGYLEAIRKAFDRSVHLAKFRSIGDYVKSNTEARELQGYEWSLDERVKIELDERIPEPWKSVSRVYEAQVFVDAGYGFTEKMSVRKEISGRERKVIFDVSGFEDVRKWRFDPIANYTSAIRVGEVKVVDKEGNEYILSEKDSNADTREGDILVFKNIDPQIYFVEQHVAQPKEVVVELEFVWIDKKGYTPPKDSGISRGAGLLQETDQVIAAKDREIREREKVIAEIMNSRTFRYGAVLRRVAAALGIVALVKRFFPAS